MIVRFNIHKSPDTTDEDFLSALACAKTCIENVLYESNPIVTMSDGIIVVDVVDLTVQQCKEKLKGCFCDYHGCIYPEFKHVEVFE